MIHFTDLDPIRERDKNAVTRLGNPDEDPLLRAEMDRRELLAEIDRLRGGFVTEPTSRGYIEIHSYVSQRVVEVNTKTYNPPREGDYDDSKYGFLYGAEEDCYHEVVAADGGGVRCRKCPGWFCY